MTAGSTNAGRSAVPMAQNHSIDRETLRKIPDLSHAEWRDFCGLHMGLPLDEYAEAGGVLESTARRNATAAHGIIVDFLRVDTGETAAEDYVSVELENKTARQQAGRRDVSKSAVRNNIRTVRDRLPLLVDELEGSE